MSYMINKFKGKYRLKAPYDLSTNQFPRDLKNVYSDLDIYIDCQNNIQIFYFGHSKLEVIIPSLGRGHNIIKAIYSDFICDINTSKYAETNERVNKDGELITQIIINYDELYRDPELNKLIMDIGENDEEVYFKFKADLMEQFEKYFKPKTSAADRSPFSSRNLPKSNYEIPEDDLLIYKEISSKLPKEDVLKLGHLTTSYIKTLANRKNKIEDIKDDMKRKCMKSQQYIHSIGRWSDYLKYLEKEIGELL